MRYSSRSCCCGRGQLFPHVHEIIRIDFGQANTQNVVFMSAFTFFRMSLSFLEDGGEGIVLMMMLIRGPGVLGLECSKLHDAINCFSLEKDVQHVCATSTVY